MWNSPDKNGEEMKRITSCSAIITWKKCFAFVINKDELNHFHHQTSKVYENDDAQCWEVCSKTYTHVCY